MTAQTYLPILVSPIVAWRVYLRTRYNIGRQPLKTSRITGRIAIFSAISIGFGILVAQYPRVLLGLGGGLSLGALAALLAGLPLTTFEETPAGRFYKPHAGIGVVLSIILVGRIIYRYYMLNSASVHYLQNYPGRFQSPLTAFLLGLTTGYYLAYYTGLLIRGRKLGSAS
jgi:hypothetical protein